MCFIDHVLPRTECPCQASPAQIFNKMRSVESYMQAYLTHTGFPLVMCVSGALCVSKQSHCAASSAQQQHMMKAELSEWSMRHNMLTDDLQQQSS